MEHLPNVSLKDHKGLKSCQLLSLGKINVLCGPNNSGKTTVLESISNPACCFVGIRTTTEFALSIAKKGLAGGTSWGSNSHVDSQYLQAVQVGLLGKETWFSNEQNELRDSIDWSFAGRWANPEAGLSTAFNNIFPKHPKTVLIPAKRKLETSIQPSSLSGVKPDGAGIINYLFTAKNQESQSELRKQFDKIVDAFREISKGYEFDIFFQIKSKTQNPLPPIVELRFRKPTTSWIQAEDCGMGLQELLIILYFALASEHEVVLIEEPENHLHPEIQRLLIAFLREKTEKQFFISTHSSVFLNTQFIDRVFTCKITDSVCVTHATSRAELLTELGYSIADNLVSDLVVLCEGPKDKLVLEEFFHKMGLTNQSNIKIWPLGGDIMGQLDLTVFKESHQLIAVVDNDPGSARVRKKFLDKCAELQLRAVQLQRYAIESYFSLPAIASIMKGQMPSNIPPLDHSKPIGEQLGFEVKANGQKIAKAMSLDDVKGTDFEEFLKEVETMAAQNHIKSAG